MSKLKAAIRLKPYAGRIRPGGFIGMPMDAYQAAPGLSSSLLRVLLRSPLEFQRMQTGKLVRETTDAMAFGTVAHSTILENKFDAFYVQPDTYGDGKKWNGNASECKAWNEAHSDKPVLTARQVAELSEAAGYVHNHPKVVPLLAGGNFEASFFAGQKKARVDHVRIEGTRAIITDLKTTTDASTGAFSREILNRGYHIQFAWYRRVLRELGCESFKFYFIALQKGALPLVNVRELCQTALDAADVQIDAALHLLEQCEANNFWPEWSDYDGTNEIGFIDIPSWAYPEQELTGAEEAA